MNSYQIPPSHYFICSPIFSRYGGFGYAGFKLPWTKFKKKKSTHNCTHIHKQLSTSISVYVTLKIYGHLKSYN